MRKLARERLSSYREFIAASNLAEPSLSAGFRYQSISITIIMQETSWLASAEARKRSVLILPLPISSQNQRMFPRSCSYQRFINFHRKTIYTALFSRKKNQNANLRWSTIAKLRTGLAIRTWTRTRYGWKQRKRLPKVKRTSCEVSVDCQ